MKENTCGCGCGCEEEEEKVDACGCGEGCDCDDDACDCGDGGCGDGGCGCGHDHAHGPQMITLTMEDDTELNCIVLGVFEFEGKEYMALLPENDDQRVFFYHFSEEDGGINLENIESEDEFNAVAAHFMSLIQEEE